MDKFSYRLATTIKRNTVLIYIMFLLAMIENCIFFFSAIFKKENNLPLWAFALIWVIPYYIVIVFSVWNFTYLWKIYKILDDEEQQIDIQKINKLFKFLFIIGYWGEKYDKKIENKTEKQKRKLEKISRVNPWMAWFLPIYWIII